MRWDDATRRDATRQPGHVGLGRAGLAGQCKQGRAGQAGQAEQAGKANRAERAFARKSKHHKNISRFLTKTILQTQPYRFFV